MSGWAALAGAANYVGGQIKDDQDEQRWEEKYTKMKAMEQAQQAARDDYLRATEPPKVDKQNAVDANGQPIIQNRQWNAPTRDEVAQGKKGSWEVTGSAPDINFEKLDETQRNNDLKNANAQERLRMQGEVNAAKMEAAGARAGAGGKAVSYDQYNAMSDEQKATYDRFRRGEKASPDDVAAAKEDRDAKLADQKAQILARKDANKEGEGMSDTEKANLLYSKQVDYGADPFKSVIGGAKSAAPPLAQFQGPQAQPAAQPQQSQQKSPYPDGKVLYKNGQKYIVQNGVPVPAQ